MAQFAIDEVLTTGIQISGFIFDYSSSLGTPGQVLACTSSGVMWQADSSNADLASLSGQIAATGTLLNNRINSLSGYSNATFATITNLATTDSALDTKINTLSGYSNANFATILNLAATGSTLDTKINTLSGYSNANFATILNLAATGSTLDTKINSLSGYAGNTFLSGVGVSNYVPRWSGTKQLVTGSIYDIGTAVGIGTTSPAAKLQISKIGDNGSNGLVDYGIVTVSSGYDTQATLGAETIGDGYSNLNLGSNMAGVRTFWHISKRLSSSTSPHALQYFYYNGSTFNELFTFATGGSLGIGSNNPAAKLDIRQSSATTALKVFTNDTTTAYIAQFIGYDNALGDTTRMVIQAGGSVGIGTLTPASRLAVEGGSISTVNATGTDVKLSFDVRALVGGAVGFNNAAATNVYGVATGLAYLGVAQAYPLVFTTNGTERLRIAAGGNVGIGTTAPEQKLHIASSAAFAAIKFSNSTNSAGIISYFADNLYFYTSNAQRLTIDTNGNVGIGTTSPATLLHVDTAGADARIRVSAGTNTVQGGMIANTGTSLVYAGSVTNHGFSLRTNDTDRVRIDTNGNVGIGTASPIGKLTVQGNIEVNYNSTTADSFVRRTFLTSHALVNRGSNIGFGLIDGGGLAGMTVYNTASSSSGYNSQFIGFNTHEGNVSTDERMRITQSGYVGIGTFTPLSLLSVGTAGSTSAANGLTFGGDASANLYRISSSRIKTDGSLEAAVGIISPTITSLSGNIAATGSVLDTKINTLSGYSNATFATITNLAATGSVLDTKINTLSGYSNSTFATVVNLAATGSTLDTKINTTNTNLAATGSTLDTKINTTNTNLAATGSTLDTKINTTNTNLAATGSTLDTKINTTNTNLAATGSTLDTKINTTNTNLAATGSTLNARINSLSGYAGSTFLSGQGTANWTSRWNGAKELITGSIYDLGTGIGIGTTSPTSRLTVVQSAGADSVLLDLQSNNDPGIRFGRPTYGSLIRHISDTVDYIAFNCNGASLPSVAATAQVVIDENGNVGIGTTNPAHKLEVYNTANSQTYVRINNQNNGISAYAGVDLQSYGGGWQVRVPASTTFVNPLLFSFNEIERARITSDGKVGIGTASPTTLLSVGGAGSTAAASGITFGADASANLYRESSASIRTDGAFLAAGRIRSLDYIQFNSNLYSNAFTNPIDINVGNVAGNAWLSAIRFNQGGYVGIGTNQPSGKLHIVSSVAGETVLRTDGTNGTLFSVVDDLSDSLMSVNNSAGLPVLEVFADDRVVAGQYGSGDFVLINNKVGIGTSNPANKLSVIGAASIGSNSYNVSAPANGLIVEGSVGIGTTSSSYKLRVYDANNTTPLSIEPGDKAAFRFAGNSTSVYTTTFNINDTALYIGHDSSVRSFNLQTNSTDRLTIKGDGNIGIGITSPLQKLQVDGVVGNPASVGVTQSGIFRISNTTDNAVLDFGIRAGGLGAWIQSTDETSLAANYPLLLNPNGGNVGIGTTNPTGKLSVDSFGANAFNVCDSFSSNVRVTVATVNTAGFTYGLIQTYQHNTNTAGVSPLNIQPFGGNVGIGTSVPTGLLNVTRNSNTAQPIAFFKELFGSPAATNILLLERGNNLSAANQTTSNAGLRIRDHSSDYSLSIEDHNSNVNFAISGSKVLVGSRGTNSLLNVGGAGSALAASGLTFGGDAEANLYRSAEDTIKTDGSLIVAGNVTAANLVSGNGTANFITKWNGTKSIANSQIFDDGTYVGINTAVNTTYRLQVIGSFAATTKSFDITHPTVSGKRLAHASLEGPENGVYFRGRNNNSEIKLPHYWSGLVHDDSITVDLTSIGKRKDGKVRDYSVDQIGDNKVYIYTDSDDNIYNYYYTIFAERKDVSKLVTERYTE
jgi:hypothetical protein